jgi:hypothetical protein
MSRSDPFGLPVKKGCMTKTCASKAVMAAFLAGACLAGRGFCAQRNDPMIKAADGTNDYSKGMCSA